MNYPEFSCLKIKLKKLENIIKSSGIAGTINLFGGFDNYCKVFKIEGPMDFLKSLPLMDVVQSEEKPDWSLFRYEKGKNMMVYDRKIETVYINYDEIWEVLSNKFELNYSETEKLTKEWLDEVYNLRGVTTLMLKREKSLQLDEVYNLK